MAKGGAKAKGGPDPEATGKERAGRRAAEEVRDGMLVGLGTGSTVHFTIVAIGERKPDVTCVATSVATEQLADELGIRVVPPGSVDRLDIAIDGADQVDADFNLIKGGGGADTREKIVASMSDRFVVVVDESKVADRLDIPVPIEVVEFAIDLVPKALTAFGATHVRQRSEPSDNGNPLLDAAFESHRRSAGARARARRDPRAHRARHLPRRDGGPGRGRRRRRGRRRARPGARSTTDVRRAPQSRAMLANFVRWSRNASRVMPVGPLRCLATITSAVPRWSDSGL